MFLELFLFFPFLQWIIEVTRPSVKIRKRNSKLQAKEGWKEKKKEKLADFIFLSSNTQIKTKTCTMKQIWNMKFKCLNNIKTFHQGSHHLKYIGIFTSFIYKARTEKICLTSWRRSFFDLSSECKFNSRRPFGGVIFISRLWRSTIGTIASTKGIQTRRPDTPVSIDVGFPVVSRTSSELLSMTCKRSAPPLSNTLTTVPRDWPVSWRVVCN